MRIDERHWKVNTEDALRSAWREVVQEVRR